MERLQRLSIRIREMRSARTVEPQFANAPPSLPDVVCLAALEANMARPHAYFTVSGTEWPAVRIQARWTAILEAAMLFLVDLGTGNLEAQAALQETGVEVSLTVRVTESHTSSGDPEMLKGLDESLQLSYTARTASVRLFIPFVLDK